MAARRGPSAPTGAQLRPSALRAPRGDRLAHQAGERHLRWIAARVHRWGPEVVLPISADGSRNTVADAGADAGRGCRRAASCREPAAGAEAAPVPGAGLHRHFASRGRRRRSEAPPIGVAPPVLVGRLRACRRDGRHSSATGPRSWVAQFERRRRDRARARPSVEDLRKKPSGDPRAQDGLDG